MARLHLFEFGNQNWLPDAWRNYITEYLQFMVEHGPFEALPDLMARVWDDADRPVVDLCSGSGGPWPAYLDAETPTYDDDVQVTLTDLHPNREAFERIAQRTGGRASGYDRPVDATDVPAELEGPRTIVNGLHNFRPQTARAIFADAVDAGVAIGAFEIMDRRPVTLLSTLLVPLFVVLVTPFVRPLRWGRFLWTYLIPVVPFLILWDGMVSALRTYSPDELRELVADFDSYDWDIGTDDAGPGPARVTYIIGRPRRGA